MDLDEGCSNDDYTQNFVHTSRDPAQQSWQPALPSQLDTNDNIGLKHSYPEQSFPQNAQLPGARSEQEELRPGDSLHSDDPLQFTDLPMPSNNPPATPSAPLLEGLVFSWDGVSILAWDEYLARGLTKAKMQQLPLATHVFFDDEGYVRLEMLNHLCVMPC